MTGTPPAPPRVVIVDDSALVRDGLVRLLRDAGFAVAGVASSAVRGIEAIDRLRPDLVVLDLAMPGSGFAVLRALKERADAPAVVVFSQYASTPYRVRARELGAAAMLDKAFDFSRLTDVLWRVHRTPVPAP